MYRLEYQKGTLAFIKKENENVKFKFIYETK